MRWSGNEKKQFYSSLRVPPYWWLVDDLRHFLYIIWHSVPGQGSVGLKGAGGPGGSGPEARKRDVM